MLSIVSGEATTRLNDQSLSQHADNLIPVLGVFGLGVEVNIAAMPIAVVSTNSTQTAFMRLSEVVVQKGRRALGIR